jgi:hypothetical protein
MRFAWLLSVMARLMASDAVQAAAAPISALVV